ADDGVVHAVLAAEIPHGAVSGVDAHACPERALVTLLAPFGVKLGDARLHLERHRHACLGVLGDALGFGSPKKAMIASPTYLSSVAPYLRAIPAISLR